MVKKYEHTWGGKVTQTAYEPTPIELLNRILDLIWDVERNLSFENLLGHARDYVELTIRQIEKELKDGKIFN